MQPSIDNPKNSQPEMPRVFGAIRALLARGLRGLGKVRMERRLQLIETLPLGGKRQLLLIACDGRPFLLGSGSDSITAITPIQTAGSPYATAAIHSIAENPTVAGDGRFIQ